MARLTKKHLQGVFARFCRDMKKPEARSFKQAGYELDYNDSYGGWKIIEHRYENSSAAEYDPFGAKRRRLSEMCEVLYFACEALELKQREDAARAQARLESVGE